MERARSRKEKHQYDGKIAGLYDLEETIGRGHFAVVKLARHVFTGEKVAVKVIDKTKLDEVSKAHLFQEVRCMKLVQHPNVVRLYEVIDTQTKLYLILELGDGGDMYDYIMKHDKGLTEEVARRYFRQIVQAINYCHKLHVVHRDLKPENVVFFEKLGIVKLTDFGFSNKFIPGRPLETSCGSLAYSAPEILLGDSYDPPAVDVWSLGVILYMLVCGEPPFQEANDSETLTMIMDCKYRIPSHISQECRDLIAKMLVREPVNRAALMNITLDPWLKTGETVPIPLLPLISRESLTEDDHCFIIQRMVDGKIASKEEVIRSLERNAYDHITSTYYLLAERRLRRQREAQNLLTAKKKKDPDNKPALAPLALSPRAKPAENSQSDRQHRVDVDSLVSPPGTHPAPQTSAPVAKAQNLDVGTGYHPRRCSFIREESIEEDEEEMDTDSGHDVKSKSMEDCLSDDSDSRSSERSPSRSKPTRRAGQGARPLHSVRSSPQLLNQIFEECESEDELSLTRKRSSPLLIQRNSVASPEIIRKFEHTRKKRMTAGSRGTSCSSSDASDTDETDSRKRKEKLKQRLQRRDSSDLSSDTDGPGGGPGGGNQSLGGGGGSSRDHSDGKGPDHDKRGGNDENRHTSKSRGRKHSGGKKHGSLNLGKESSISEKTQSEMGQKISNMSMTSNLSNLSLTSLSSRSSKYLVESSSNTMTPKITKNTTKDVIDALNEENKHRTRIIHVRSKDFSDLMDRFNPNGGTSSKDSQVNVKFRRRSKDKMKTDINRNGLIARADGELTALEAKQQDQLQPTVKTKCCSLV